MIAFCQNKYPRIITESEPYLFFELDPAELPHKVLDGVCTSMTVKMGMLIWEIDCWWTVLSSFFYSSLTPASYVIHASATAKQVLSHVFFFFFFLWE